LIFLDFTPVSRLRILPFVEVLESDR